MGHMKVVQCGRCRSVTAAFLVKHDVNFVHWLRLVDSEVLEVVVGLPEGKVLWLCYLPDLIVNAIYNNFIVARAVRCGRYEK